MRGGLRWKHVGNPGHHDNDDQPSEVALRVKALESLLAEKGLVDPAALDAIIEFYEHKVGPHIGAGVIAHAWADPDYKARLLADGTAAIGELGIQGPQGGHIIVVENTRSVHNLIVCTLCSCYPVAVLGCRQFGISRRPTNPVRSSIHAVCCKNWVPICLKI
jgi:nitrile hydratase subunit alpha